MSETMQHTDVPKGHIHIIHNNEFATLEDRDKFIPTNEDLDKICLVRNPYGFYALSSISPMTWEKVGSNPEKDEIYKSMENPTTSINPKEKGMLWVNFLTPEIFICTDNTKDQNTWKGSRGTVIEKEPTWIPPIKGSKIQETFTKDAIKVSEKEYTQFETTIRTNTIQVAGYEFYKAFDGLTTWGDGTWATSWASETTPLPNWIEIETKEKRLASSFKFMQPYNGANCITELYIQGSNDGINYTDLAKMNPTITYNEYQSVTFQNPSYYKIYRVKITKKNTNGVGSAGMEFIY